MKKNVIVVVLLVLVFGFVLKDDNKVLSNDMIRFRVIANSNLESDQKIKMEVVNNLSKDITSKLRGVKSNQEARGILKNSLPEFENIVSNTLDSNMVDSTFNINYGMNYFPEKIYNGVVYDEGEYESLVVTLGKGEGENWWCVLFPPVCLMEAEENVQEEEITYRFFLQEFFENLFS